MDLKEKRTELIIDLANFSVLLSQVLILRDLEYWFLKYFCDKQEIGIKRIGMFLLQTLSPWFLIIAGYKTDNRLKCSSCAAAANDAQ